MRRWSDGPATPAPVGAPLAVPVQAWRGESRRTSTHISLKQIFQDMGSRYVFTQLMIETARYPVSRELADEFLRL